MERMFTRGEVVPFSGSDDEATDYETKVQLLIDDSVDFQESFLGSDRTTKLNYYHGISPALSDDISGEETPVYDGDTEETRPHRSTIISSDVRDAVLAVLPSLVRIFCGTENVVDCVPTRAETEELAKQQTDYLNYVFWEDNDGFMTLYTVFKDALRAQMGIVKWWTDDDEEQAEKTFQNLTREQIQLIISEFPDVEVVDAVPDISQQFMKEITFRYTVSKPHHKVAAVPQDEFRISRDAKDVKTARLTGHEREVTMSELIKMGYDEADLEEFRGTSRATLSSDERSLRTPGLDFGGGPDDLIRYGEWDIYIDADGDGIDELRRICTIGDHRKIVDDQPLNRRKLAIFRMDPEPHSIMSDDIADLTMDIQRIKTNVFRGTLDSLAESINPKTVINELLVNIDDALNDDLGAVIRTRGDPSSTVSFNKIPFIGEEALAVIGAVDALAQRRTGISEASRGLDPKALQSTALVGVDAVIQGAQERIELVARILAETGFKHLFKGLLEEISENPAPDRTIQIRGKWIEIQPSLFDASMSIRVNPTLGKGSDLMRLQTLSMIEQKQILIIEKFGLDNPVCGVNEVLNTIADQLELANIRNVTRYFKAVPPEVEEAIRNTPKEPDPMLLAAQAELEKVKADLVKAQAKLNSDENKQVLDDDYKRDKMAIDAILRWSDIKTKDKNAQLDRSTQITLDQMNQPPEEESGPTGSAGAGG